MITILQRFSVLVALMVGLAYGVLVFATNPRRTSNQQFFLLTVVLSCWLWCVWAIITAATPAAAAFWIRQATVLATLVPTSFNLLRLSIKYRDESWLGNVRRIRWLLLLNLGLALLYQSGLFLREVRLPPPAVRGDRVADPVYGPGYAAFAIYYIVFLGYLLIKFLRDLRGARGAQKAELTFVLLGCGACIFTGTMLGAILPAVTGSSQSAPFMPLCVIFLTAIIAYGVATRRIMDVGYLVRRLTAYALVLVYLVALYVGVLYAARFVTSAVLPPGSGLPHLLAAVAMAVSLAPAHGWMQRFVARLFGSRASIEPTEIVRRASRAMQTITTQDELLRIFSKVLTGAMGTDDVRVLVAHGDRFEEAFSTVPDRAPAAFDRPSSLEQLLREEREPLETEGLRRRRQTPVVGDARGALEAAGAVVAAGFSSKGQLAGLVLLGARLSGRLYTALEQDVLQLLCNQFGAALENARLYTEVQNARRYNDLLVDSLVSGVVAMNADGKVSVFNREAQRITRLEAAGVVGCAVDVLPAAIAVELRGCFAGGAEVMDRDIELGTDGEQVVPVRLSCSAFYGHAGDLLGALAVFNDMSLLKKLEEQVRRSDRLSSIGTLAAGMAHEIKNPLVSISTFTQLLPERYEDAEFRDTFFSLIGKEVKRIDSIVNRLLKFSRPAKARLQEVHLHVLVEEALGLVSQQVRRKGLSMACELRSDIDLIMGDVDLLNQALINFLLNAIEATNEGGRLQVETDRVTSRWYAARRAQRTQDARIRLRIRDTGCGIPAENVPRIFDPFFTTKSSGTGLGLSVAHGIIEEHSASIEVDSAPGRGTVFTILFPLIANGREEAA